MHGAQPEGIDVARLLAVPPAADPIEQQCIAAHAKARLLGTSSPVRIGRYELLRWLGAGAFGVVYAARDPDMGRDVAIKLLHPTADRDATILREARMQAQVDDPHVVEVFDVGRSDGRPFVVMRLVDGGDVEGWWREEAPSADAILDAIAQAGRGLAAAHRIGLVHRDVKPTNLLRTTDGVIKVADFGLAIAPSHARAGGTPRFMAPEQRAGGPLDARADQFALALVATRLLGAKHGVARVLDRALQIDPDRRFATMDRFVDALERARRPRRRAPWWGAAAAAMVVALAMVPRAEPLAIEVGCGEAIVRADLFVDRQSVAPATCPAVTVDPGTRAGMQRIETALAEIREGRDEAATDELTDILAARGVEYGDDVRAEAWYLRGKLAVRHGDDALAGPYFEAAYHRAVDAQNWWIAVDSATNLAGWAAERQEREAATRWLRDAAALIERAGDPPYLRAVWWNAAIGVHAARGEIDEALTAAREAVAIHRRLGPTEKLVSALRGHAMVSLMSGRADEAEPLIGEALDVSAALWGPAHRGRGELLDLRSGAWMAMHRPEAALESQREAVVALSSEYGHDHPITHAPRLNLASVLIELDHGDEARAVLRELVNELDAADSASRVRPKARLELARALRLAGRPDEAEPLAVRAIVELESRSDLGPTVLGEASEELAAIRRARAPSINPPG